MHTNQRGISLIEMLIVVTIILIITGMAIPAVLRTLEAYRLDSSASIITGKLQDARINAIKRNRQAWLAIDVAAGRMQAQTIDPAAPPAILNLGNPELLPRGVVFVAPPTPGQIIFDSLGRPTALPTPPPHSVVLRVVRSGQQKTVTITPTGRVRVN